MAALGSLFGEAFAKCVNEKPDTLTKGRLVAV
jgi:hypothetical protein